MVENKLKSMEKKQIDDNTVVLNPDNRIAGILEAESNVNGNLINRPIGAYESHPQPKGCPSHEEFSEGMEKAMKNDKADSKVMMQLLPPLAQERIAEVFTFGAKKYDDWNWSKGMEHSRLYGALNRHMTAWYKGENKDPETGKSHLAHAGCCIMMLLELDETRPDLDDRPKHYKK